MDATCVRTRRGVRGSASPLPRDEREHEPRTEVDPVEGETRLCMLGPGGAIFETDYHWQEGRARSFTVLWFNADASGFMDLAKGDRIMSVRHDG